MTARAHADWRDVSGPGTHLAGPGLGGGFRGALSERWAVSMASDFALLKGHGEISGLGQRSASLFSAGVSGFAERSFGAAGGLRGAAGVGLGLGLSHLGWSAAILQIDARGRSSLTPDGETVLLGWLPVSGAVQLPLGERWSLEGAGTAAHVFGGKSFASYAIIGPVTPVRTVPVGRFAVFEGRVELRHVRTGLAIGLLGGGSTGGEHGPALTQVGGRLAWSYAAGVKK